jgi:hypothetical protein
MRHIFSTDVTSPIATGGIFPSRSPLWNWRSSTRRTGWKYWAAASLGWGLPLKLLKRWNNWWSGKSTYQWKNHDNSLIIHHLWGFIHLYEPKNAIQTEDLLWFMQHVVILGVRWVYVFYHVYPSRCSYLWWDLCTKSPPVAPFACDAANLVWYCAGNPRFQCQKGETPSMHGAYRSTLPGCIKQRISISAFIIMSVFVIFGLWQWEKEVSLSLSTGTVQPGFLVWWVGSDDAATPT